MAVEPLVVQAIHSFTGTNNDELCFKKGDIITITQKEDGGWWEGTLNGKTGWFPNNYVKECKDAPVAAPITSPSQQKQYRDVVLKDLTDSEKAHVTELQGLVTNFLLPLEKSNILTSDEYKQLTSNLRDVLDNHQQLLNLLEEEIKLNHEERVGRLFLTWAPKIKNVHQMYCSLHPRAVCILDKYKEELTKFMESSGAASPGVLVLTTGLSKPFRRLDKYSGMLQELERHVEESHPDRGDTQRSVAVYKDIAAACAATRRQKELELQVLTGPVRGWEGQSLSTLGDIIYMGSVAIGPQHHDRYLVLFPSTLLMLSVSHRLSAFIYEGKLPLTGIVVNRLEDSDQYKNAFEISGPMIEKRTAVCQSKDEANHWVELLRKHMPNHSKSTGLNQKVSPSQVEIVPQPHLNLRGYCNRTSVLSYAPSVTYNPTYPPLTYPSASPYAGLTKLYCKLIKEKSINKKLLKQVLYTEYINKFNLSDVKRRQHKTECVIIRRDSNYRASIIKCDSDSDSESSSDGEGPTKICRQNAIDDDTSYDSSNSSGNSNPFGYIRYYNPQTGEEREQTKYESFIDYGTVSMPKMVRRQSTKPSIILTSTAKVQLVKQESETSEASSGIVPKILMACEDLLNLDSSFEIDTHNPEIFLPTTRQSCPTKLVANKFNASSLTTIYIPTWQSSSDNNLCLPKLQNQNPHISSSTISTTESSSCSTTTHSSSIDIPVNVAPLPDAMVAELLYNFDADSLKSIEKSESIESDQTELSSKTVIKPPAMFQTADQAMPLNLEHIGFKRHSINSDKPRRRSSIHINPADDPYKSLQRCCPESCHSPRSSDSGMAGSCTLNSPDFTPNDLYAAQERCSMDMSSLFQKYSDLSRFNTDSRNVMSLSEIEARTYESQCQCTSPFGSTPRTSCQPSIGENVLSGTQHDSANTSVTSSLDFYNFPVPQPWQSENQIHSKLLSIRSNLPNTNPKPKPQMRGFRQPTQKSKSLSNIATGGDARLTINVKDDAEKSGKTEIYRSGLYAHWWLKAKIPAEVIRGIYEETQSTATGKGAPMSPLMSARGMLPNHRQGGSINEARLTPTLPSHGTLNNNKAWSASCLRPAPPLSPCLALCSNANGSPIRTNRKSTIHNEDALILEVIEIYCSTIRNRNTVNSVNMHTSNGQRISEASTRNVSEVVHILQGQVKNLEGNVNTLTSQLVEERAARYMLQSIVRTYLTANSKDVDSIEWPKLDSNIFI